MGSPEPICFYTIGYQGKTMEEFLRGLHESDIQTVVDVRATPISRRKGFSKTALMQALEQAGIQYVGAPELGVARPLREQYRDCAMSDFEPEYRRIVLDSREDKVSEMLELVVSESVCLLCYEEDPADCHRSLLSLALVQRIGRDANVVHL